MSNTNSDSVIIKVNPKKIGAIIGSRGKVIREIIEATGTTIDIEDDGIVKISGTPGPQMDQAINWVKTLAGQIDVGSVYTGKIKRVVDFGIFIELAPGLDGLLHISKIPAEKLRNISQYYNTNDVVNVEVLDANAETGRVSLQLVN